MDYDVRKAEKEIVFLQTTMDHLMLEIKVSRLISKIEMNGDDSEVLKLEERRTK